MNLGLSLGEFTHQKNLSYYPDKPRYLRALKRYSEGLAGVGSTALYPKYSSIWCNAATQPYEFAPQGSAFPSALMLDSLKRRGVTPVIFFETSTYDAPDFSNSAWASGQHDEYLLKWGQSAGNWGRRFILRINQEMNGGWAPWSPGFYDNTPENYVTSWRRIVGMIEDGIQDVGGDLRKMQTVWAPQHRGKADVKEIWDYYPGNAYVDILGFDAYESKHTQKGTIERRFTPTYEALITTVPDKNVIVTETGVCASNGPDFCSKWLEEGLAYLSTLDRFKALMYFNIDMSKPDHRDHDWRMAPETQRIFASYLTA